jgi:hypothetical protein
MPSVSKWVCAACVSARNLAFGGSVASLSLLGKPRTLFEHATESLFLYQSLSGKRGIPEKFVFEVLPGNRQYELAIANFQCEVRMDAAYWILFHRPDQFVCCAMYSIQR